MVLSSAASPQICCICPAFEKPGQMGNTRAVARGAASPPHPDLVLSLTLLSSGVGGRGFFEAEMRKTEKENEHETECAPLKVSGRGLFREKGPQREQQEGRMRHKAWVFFLSACSFPILFSRRHQRLPEANIWAPLPVSPGKASPKGADVGSQCVSFPVGTEPSTKAPPPVKPRLGIGDSGGQ